MSVQLLRLCRLVTLCAILCACAARGGELKLEDSATFGAAEASASNALKIISSTDIGAMRTALQSFASANPKLAIRYDQASSLTVYELARRRASS